MELRLVFVCTPICTTLLPIKFDLLSGFTACLEVYNVCQGGQKLVGDLIDLEDDGQLFHIPRPYEQHNNLADNSPRWCNGYHYGMCTLGQRRSGFVRQDRDHDDSIDPSPYVLECSC